MPAWHRGLHWLTWLNTLFVAWVILDQSWRLFRMYQGTQSPENGGRGVEGYPAFRKLGRWEIPRV